ncbi:kinase-like protein [Pyrenochaeta sp. DS3sAY3a]|nr:kinase-like protein [Pyrenochaeta sp. DS3sAY3a]
MTSVRLPFATPTERLATYFDTDQPRVAFEDREIDDVALLLEQCGHIASKCPRTYILLRTIGRLDTIDRLVKVGFSDQLFPVEPRSLPSFLEPSVKSAVVQHQSIILTKSLDLENGRHRHFAPEEVLPFDILGRLGSGGYGQVDRIVSKTSYRQFALKRIRRRAAFGNTSSREALKGFLNEMKIMRSLEHRHIVQYIGSYTDKSFLGLVMSPVAETDLATYTEALCAQYATTQPERSPSPFYLQTQATAGEMVANLRTFFGCLTAALAYLHDQNIRHKDIKPQNILVSKDNVLFSDFGLSRDFGDDVGSTTSGITPASARYCAPEVATYEARNTSSDIWSLGCVFLEMSAAMHGMNVSGIKTFFDNSSSHGTHYHANPAATTQMIRELENVGDRRNRRALTWIEKMVLVDRVARPTAAQVLDMITMPEASDQDESPNMFCGICCVPYLESDSMDSLADDFDNITAVLRQNPGLKEARREIQSQTPELPPADTPKPINPVKPPDRPEKEIQPSPRPTEAESHESVKPWFPPQFSAPSTSSSAQDNLQLKEKSPVVRGHDNMKPLPSIDASSGPTRPPKLSQNPFLKNQIAAATNPHLDDKAGENRLQAADEHAKTPNGTLSSGISPSSANKVSGETVLRKSTMNLGDNRHKVEAKLAPGGDVPADLVVVVDAAEPSASDVHTAKPRSNTLVSQKVFGEPLSTSIKYASYELRDFKTIGGSYLNGPIPLVVAKFCDFVRNDRKSCAEGLDRLGIHSPA